MEPQALKVRCTKATQYILIEYPHAMDAVGRVEIDEKLSRTQLKVGDSGVFVINLPSSFRQPAHDHRGEL